MSEHPIIWRSKPTDPPEVRSRLAELADYVPERARRITEGIERHRAAINRRFKNIRLANRSIRQKLRALWDLADFTASHTADNVACKRGCSHCCHCAVMIPQQEAELIGHLIGRKPASAPRRSSAEHIDWGYHNPCPFLRDGECSIYEWRPLECRLMFSADVDALLCELRPPNLVPMPRVNLQYISAMQVAIVGADAHFADIREWFPREPASAEAQ